MLNSEITGEFVEVVSQVECPCLVTVVLSLFVQDSNKIVQKWRRKGWPEGRYTHTHRARAIFVTS